MSLESKKMAIEVRAVLHFLYFMTTLFSMRHVHLRVSAQRALVPSPPPHAVEVISRRLVSFINQLIARAYAPTGRSHLKNVSHRKQRSHKIQKVQHRPDFNRHFLGF